jgi:hypothetical protein
MQEHSSKDGRDGRTLGYQPPAVEERAPMSAPLNTVARTVEPPSPRWRGDRGSGPNP